MSKRILSISRDPTVLKVRNMLLESAGYDTAAALNLIEVQQQLESGAFDLVVIGHTINPNEKRRVEALIREKRPGCPLLEMCLVSPEIPHAEGHVRLEDGPEGLLAEVGRLLGPAVKRQMKSSGKKRRRRARTDA